MIHTFPTFHQGVKAICADYTIAIPDGFVLEMNTEGRDFIARLPDPQYADDPDCALITLFPVPNPGLNRIAFLDKDILPIFLESTWISAAEEMPGVGLWEEEKGEAPKVELGMANHVFAYFAQRIADTVNFHILLGLTNLKQMRVMIKDKAGMTDDRCKRFLHEWIATLVTKDAMAGMPSLSDAQYLSHKMDTVLLEQWKKDKKICVEQVWIFHSSSISLIQKKCKGANGQELTPKIISEIGTVISKQEGLIASTKKLISRQIELGCDEDLLCRLYREAIDLTKIDAFFVNLEGRMLKNESAICKTAQEEWLCALAQIEKPLNDKKKAEATASELALCTNIFEKQLERLIAQNEIEKNYLLSLENTRKEAQERKSEKEMKLNQGGILKIFGKSAAEQEIAKENVTIADLDNKIAQATPKDLELQLADFSRANDIYIQQISQTGKKVYQLDVELLAALAHKGRSTTTQIQNYLKDYNLLREEMDLFLQGLVDLNMIVKLNIDRKLYYDIYATLD